MKAKWINIFSEFGVYLATVTGVLVSRYLPAIMTTGDTSQVMLSAPNSSELIGAFVVAALVTYILDSKGDKDGKLRAIKRRLFSAFAYGFSLCKRLLEGLNKWPTS